MMPKKNKKQKSTQTAARPDPRRRRPAHRYHRSDVILGFLLILLVPALGFLGYYLFWREHDEEFPVPTSESVEITPWQEGNPVDYGIETKERRSDSEPESEAPPPAMTGEEFDALCVSADAGDADAQYLLARHLADGTEKNYFKAAELFRRAAEQGHIEAAYRTGLCYDLGKGIEEDAAQAVSWYTKAAESGYIKAQYRLGECFDYGHGVPKDSDAADRWFLAAAERGDAKAQYKVGMRLTSNYKIPQNLEKAFAWFQKAADQGYPDAQYWLGRCYSRGRGTERSPEEAFRWYLLAAEQGHAVSQNAIAECYAKGVGVSRDAGEAARWYRLAAENGNPDARRTLRQPPNR